MSGSEPLAPLPASPAIGARSPAELVQTVWRIGTAAHLFLERRAALVYGLLIALMVALSGIAAVQLTIEADESWVLLSTYKAFGLAVPGAQGVVYPTATSGGIHLLLHGLLGVVTRSILIHRLVSIAFLAGLLALVFSASRRSGGSRGDAWVAAALVLATPGIVLQSGLAMAEIIATVLLLATACYWAGGGRKSLRGAAATGILLGLTCATRSNCLACVPVFFAFALLDAQSWARGIVRAGVIALLALATYGAGMAAYAVLFGVGDWTAFSAAYQGAAGVSGSKTVGGMLRYLFIAGDFFPPFLIAALLAGLAAGWASGARHLRFPLLLVALGLAGAAAWVLKAPIPHVRYSWPFAPLLFVAAGLLLQQRAGPGGHPLVRLSLHLAVIGLVVQQLAMSVLYISTGDSVVAVYQANRRASLSGGVAGFTDGRDQRALAGYLAGLPTDARFFTINEAFGFPLTYLSGRRVESALSWDAAGPGQRYFVMMPPDYAAFRPSRAVTDWLRRNGVGVFRAGDYAAYRIEGREPMPPASAGAVTANDIYPLAQ